MKLYEWMVKPTAQKEWIDKRGILFWIAFFSIELGAGAFFAASFVGSLPAMLIGWLVCAVIGGSAHLLYLGHPLRFWRMLLKPGTSWISRGLIFIGFFLLLGLIYMALAFFTGTSPTALLVIVDIFAFLVIIYGGFAMNYVNGIPLWNTALLPILFVVSGIWGGAGVGLGVALATQSSATEMVLEEWIRILMIAYIILFVVYLVSVRYNNVISKFSVYEIVAGKYWFLMWFVVVVLGLAFPLAMSITSYVIGLEHMAVGLLYLSILLELIGDMTTRYLVLKNGYYAPLIQSLGFAAS